jgi:hypothetical protein
MSASRCVTLACGCFSLCVLAALQYEKPPAAMVLECLGSHGGIFSPCATWQFQTPRTGQDGTGKPGTRRSDAG